MPILLVKVSGQKSAEMTSRVAAALLELATRILRKDARVASIAIEYVAPEDWIVAGQSLAVYGKNIFYFDIKITDETNSKSEKAPFISEAFAALSRLVGNVHDESYVYVQDVRATSYGFGGSHPRPSLSPRMTRCCPLDNQADQMGSRP